MENERIITLDYIDLISKNNYINNYNYSKNLLDIAKYYNVVIFTGHQNKRFSRMKNILDII